MFLHHQALLLFLRSSSGGDALEQSDTAGKKLAEALQEAHHKGPLGGKPITDWQLIRKAHPGHKHGPANSCLWGKDKHIAAVEDEASGVDMLRTLFTLCECCVSVATFACRTSETRWRKSRALILSTAGNKLRFL
jgi:hypothetical protein